MKRFIPSTPSTFSNPACCGSYGRLALMNKGSIKEYKEAEEEARKEHTYDLINKKKNVKVKLDKARNKLKSERDKFYTIRDKARAQKAVIDKRLAEIEKLKADIADLEERIDKSRGWKSTDDEKAELEAKAGKALGHKSSDKDGKSLFDWMEGK